MKVIAVNAICNWRDKENCTVIQVPEEIDTEEAVKQWILNSLTYTWEEL